MPSKSTGASAPAVHQNVFTISEASRDQVLRVIDFANKLLERAEGMFRPEWTMHEVNRCAELLEGVEQILLMERERFVRAEEADTPPAITAAREVIFLNGQGAVHEGDEAASVAAVSNGFEESDLPAVDRLAGLLDDAATLAEEASAQLRGQWRTIEMKRCAAILHGAQACLEQARYFLLVLVEVSHA